MIYQPIKQASLGLLQTFTAMIVMTIAFFISAVLSNATAIHLTPEQAAVSAQMVFWVSGVNASILTYLAIRSRWTGWKLVAAIFCVQYGIETFMSQIETWVFNEALQLTRAQALSLFWSGFLRAAIFAPLLVLILGKTGATTTLREYEAPIPYTGTRFFGQITVLAAIYVIIYFVFGYYIAWQSSELRAFYTASTELLPFIPHMAAILKSDLQLVFIQFLRGYAWVLIILPIILMHRGKVWERSLAVGITLAVLLSGFILFPNPYMPKAVRFAHFTELWSSMLLFGLIAGWVLKAPKRAQRTEAPQPV